ncbi:hypothetical protein FSARC_6929 [Fusarium sarcochroum]|uniref:ATP-grasp domain-containing protein n=1 Tax=Fusarium sarcochroum TaxID=1208366 RepID=A0A8H4TW74_9HYPO|nr:hypothetical protein FSARC_6929 [Fusarium sarcochroum]
MTEITLNNTLRDLYHLDGGDEEDIALVYAVPAADIQMSAGIPPSRKYMYQSPSLPTNDSDVLAREFLQLGPQLFAFIAGEMPLFMFDLDSTPVEEFTMSGPRQYRLDAELVFSRLNPVQRPRPTFVARPADVKISSTTKVVQINPMDCMERLPQLIPSDDHYRVLSKRGLANSGLPTPKSTIHDLELDLCQISNEEAVDNEIKRISALIAESQTPFVLKLPQSLSGQGTILVRSESARETAIKVLQPELRRMASLITEENMHLQPCCIIMQQMVPGEAVAVSFFVTRAGRAVFNACCGQLIDGEGGWGGGFIDYNAQDDLAQIYGDIMNQVATYLHENNYWGPVGIDIMTDAQGQQLVIDMNVRVSGSHPLGVLKNFFQERGFDLATLLFPFIVKGTRDSFEKAFRNELQAGCLVIIGWVHMRDKKTSMSTVILGERDDERLRQLMTRVKEWEVSE